MDNKDLLKEIHENSAEMKSAVKSLETKYDVLETEKLARIDADYAAVQKELAEVRASLGRTGEQKEAAEKSAELNALFVKGLRVGFQNLTAAEQKQMQVEGTVNGSATVPEERQAEIVALREKQVALRGLANVRTIGTGELVIPVQTSASSATYKGETVDRTDPASATPQIQEVKIATFELSALPIATLEMLEDSQSNIESWMLAEAARQFAVKEGEMFIKGDGVVGPKGILAYASAIPTHSSVGEVVSGTIGTFTSTDLINLHYEVPVAYRSTASYLFSDSAVATARKLTNDQGDYLWQDQIALDLPPTLLGKAVYTDEHLDAVAADGQVAIFGDFKAGYTIVDRVGMTVTRDIYTAPGFAKFYVRVRNGGGVVRGEALRILKIKA